MSEARAAEWLLRLAVSPRRAAAAVGDLLEQQPARGPFWFWRNVFGAVATQLWHDLSDAPLRMLWLAITGLLRAWLLTIAFLNASILLCMQLCPVAAGPNAEYIPRQAFYLILILSVTLLQVAAGWDTARRSGRREFASGLALVSLLLLLAAPSLLTWRVFSSTPGNPYPIPPAFHFYLATAASLLLGALLRRLRSLESQARC